MADLKPAYLITGDDDAKIDAWRARVKRRAEDEGGVGALEAFEAASTAPDDIAAALATLSFNPGTRYLMVDGVDAWKAGGLGPIEDALAAVPPDTVIVLIARGAAADRLAGAVTRAGGEVRDCAAPKPWEMPRWVADRAADEGLHLDAEAAKALVAMVGTRPQRLARELEKLAVAAHPRTQLAAEEVGSLVSGEDTQQVYDLADALVARDAAATLRIAEDLRGREERPTRLAFPIVRRLREVVRAAELIDAGMPEKRVAAAMKLKPWVAKRTVAKARGADREALERALCAFADLEIATRGGGELDEETAFSLTLARAAA